MTVSSYEKEFTLVKSYPNVPAKMPFKRYIQEWYDANYRDNGYIIIKVYGVVWHVERGVTKVIVVYDITDWDEETQEKDVWLEFEAHRHSHPFAKDFNVVDYYGSDFDESDGDFSSSDFDDSDYYWSDGMYDDEFRD